MREVPKYEIVFEKPKKGDYAVVIPVINEGNRILSLLSKFAELRLTEVDLIIVDGGSTDGSLDEVSERGVDTLIVKLGRGKLGAQLRCAYDYCLKRGYKGVITIDGNNKDDPSEIPLFITKLKEGYDFVQASRFIQGGKEVNTPILRKIAIKLIHAPLLSYSSNFHWTDTTQGFRAYSRNLIGSQKINIFRDIFQNYELLFYLSHISPRLGFKCVEVPSTRTYPRGEVPTKISSLKGNLQILLTLMKVVMGGYDTK